MSTLRLLMTACLLTGCASTPPPTTPATATPSPHPWPMAHANAHRTGGSMLIPAMDSKPQPPQVFTLSGQLGRHNHPVITRDGHACIASTGTQRDLSDTADGVTCIDLLTQTQTWFTPTSSDAYATSLTTDALLAGTRDGTVYALSLKHGSTLWTHIMKAHITASPLIPDRHPDIVLIADHAGELAALNVKTGEQLWRVQLDGAIISGISAHKHTLVAATTHGQLSALDVRTGELLWQRQLSYLDASQGHELAPVLPARVEAAPVLSDTHAFIAYARVAPQRTPPLLAVNLTDGSIVWEATAHTPEHTTWQSQLVSPVLVEDRLIFVEPYSTLMSAVSADTGDMLFLSKKSPCIQEQLSSISHASALSVVPRHDGIIYPLSRGYGLSPWYDIAVDGSPAYFTRLKDAYRSGECRRDPPEHSGFLTTPALEREGNIVIGRADGRVLYYVRDAQ